MQVIVKAISIMAVVVIVDAAVLDSCFWSIDNLNETHPRLTKAVGFLLSTALSFPKNRNKDHDS